ncbi:MAG: sarcosine oxidase subunit gamma [Alphaproteobacteria bacterium]|nr:sarcosine oxidase subunit gamma [Alphaproteobacteria bacterium]
MAELPFVTGAVALREAAPMRQIGLRLRPPFPAYVAGLPLPLTANRAAAMGPVRVLWLGPDEWLILAEGSSRDLTARLERAVAGRSFALHDLSSGRTVLELGGRGARALLAAGCGIDLHPRAFAPGDCAQTLLARVPVILDQLDDTPRYRILLRRSYAGWLIDWLIDAAGGLAEG